MRSSLVQLPFEARGKTAGVLYYDNSYVDGCFDMIEVDDLNRMVQMVAQGNFREDLPSKDEVRRRYIRYVLEHTKGKQSGPEGAAEILGMNRSTLYNRMKKLGLN